MKSLKLAASESCSSFIESELSTTNRMSTRRSVEADPKLRTSPWGT